MSTLLAAAKAYAKAYLSLEGAATSRNQLACQLVALGYLSGMLQKEINAQARDAGGYTEEQWNGAKVALSRAWRAIAGEFGFGEALATKWAAGDFTVSLGEAYEASAPPRKESDRVAELVKALTHLSPEDFAEVVRRTTEARQERAEAEVKRAKRAEVLLAKVA